MHRSILHRSQLLSKCFANTKTIRQLKTTKITLNNEKPENWDSAKPYEAIPGPKPLPILGNAWRFMYNVDYLKLGQKMHKKYGDLVIFRKLPNFGDFMFLYNVRDIEWVLRNEGSTPKRILFPSIEHYRHVIRKDVFGDTLGLIHGQGEQWAKVRGTVNPIMMQARTTHQHIPQINDTADEFIEHMKRLKSQNELGEMPKDFINEVYKWAFESIAAIAIDTRLGCLKPIPSERALMAMRNIMEMFDLSLKIDFLAYGFIHRQFNTRTWQKYIQTHDYFTNWILELIENATQRINNEAKFNSKPEHEKSVLERLIIKDKQIAVLMVFDLFTAGTETTSNVVGAILYYLAKNPVIQEKLRKELKRLLPSKSTRLTKEILDDAKYLRACVKEGLRLAPVAHTILRWTTKNMVIGGYQVPPGVVLNLPHLYLSVGTDEHFTNCTEFRPERWLRIEGKNENIMTFATSPFGFGPRGCIGKRMALMELEIMTAKIVRNFAMKWPHKDMRFSQTLLYAIADPLKIHLTDIND